MKYRLITFISLNPCNSLFNHYYAPEFASVNSHNRNQPIDFRETWQNTILSGILKPFKRKPEIQPPDDDDLKLSPNENIKDSEDTDRLKSSVQKKFVKEILSKYENNKNALIDINSISLQTFEADLQDALIWFSKKYKFFFNPNSLSNAINEKKIDYNCTFEELGIKNDKLKEIVTNPTFSQKLYIPQLIKYLKQNNESANNRWLSSDKAENNSYGFFYHASNGSGKTYTFLLPLIEYGNGNTAIIIPTRELAVQIFNILESISPDSINQYLLIGGANIKHQIEKLKSLDYDMPNIFVTTPGRFTDLTSRKILNIKKITNFVFDEYDSYFTLPKNSTTFTVKDSFSSILKTVYNIKKEPGSNWNLYNKKIVFCSAIDREEQVINLINKEEIGLSSMNGVQNKCIKHFISTYGEGKHKVSLFKKLLDIKHLGKSVLIFVNRNEHIEFLTKVIKDYIPNANLISLSSNSEKLERSKAFDEIQRLKSRDNADVSGSVTDICITTDISSRGIDFSPFTYLINYSIPENVLLYNNRCGRLNFSGKRGVCITMCQGSDIPKFNRIVLKKLTVPIYMADPIKGILCVKSGRDSRAPPVRAQARTLSE